MMLKDPVQDLGLKAEHLAWLKACLAKHLPGQACLAFGSRAKGQAKPFSDLDLVVLSPEGPSLTTQGALLDELSEGPLPIMVDVAWWAELSPEFREAIEADLRAF